jgi:trimeric autotransporter adhesin
MIHFDPGKAHRVYTLKLRLAALICSIIASAGFVRAEKMTMAIDVGATALASPASPACYGAAENISISIMNYGGTPVDFSADPVTVTVNITGAATQTLTTTVNTGTLAASSTMNVSVGTLNMTAAGTYTFNASTSSPDDGNTSNNAMPAASRTTYPLSSLPQTVDFSGFTGSNLTTAFPGWREAAGSNPTGTTSLWTTQLNVGSQGNRTARINLFTTTRNEWIIGPRIAASSNTTLRFKAAVTDLGSPSNPDVMGPDDKVRVMVTTDCGVTWTAVMTLDASYNLTPTLTQYGINLGAYSGQEIMIAFYATDGPVDDINNYDFHLDDINISNVNGIDMGATGLIAPSGNGCYDTSETVTVNIRNHGFTTVDFATDNTTVNVNVSGPNPQTFSTTLTSGTLAPGAVMAVTMTNAYDMSQAGIYTFSAGTAVLTMDYDTGNDAMPQAYAVSTKPSVTVSPDQVICSGSSTTLSASGTAFGPTAGDVAFTSTASIPVASLDTIYSTINVTSPLYAFEIYSVTIDSLYHTYDADLDVYLIAPNGSRIELTTDNGTNGDNYINTRFIASAPTSVISGTPPFNGDYLPEQPFNMLSGSANGTWTLQVIDDAVGDDGILKGWTINMRAPNSIASYSWSPVAGLSSSTVQNPVASPVSTTTYYVTVTDQNGCTSTQEVLITVNPSPTANVTVNSMVLCYGDSNGVATVSASGGTGTYTYLWSDGQTTQTANDLQAGTYSVTVTDANLCTGTNTVSLTEPAALTISVATSNETCNPGNDGSASASISGGTPGYTYSWSDGQTTSTAAGLAAGTYTLTVTDANMCTTNEVVTINGSVPPMITASNDTTICEGMAVMLTASGGGNYAWDNNAGNNDTVTVSPVSTTIYTVTVTDMNGCTASEQVTVNVNPLAVAAFSYNNTGSTVIFSNASSNAASYTWDFGDGSPADNSTDPSYTYTLDGAYTVMLIASNGCNSDTITDIIIINTTGINEAGNVLLMITPNPSQGIFSVSTLNAEAGDLNVEIMDVQGRIVHRAQSNNASPADMIRVDARSLAKGVYHLRLISGNSLAVRKIIIQ